MIDTKIGKACFLSLKDHARNLSLLLDSSDIKTRKRVLVLLSILCNYEEEKGLDYVDDSLTFYKLVKIEKSRFEHLIKSIENSHDEDYIVKVFYLFNSLLTQCSTSLQSHKYKKEFESHGISKIIQKIKENMKKDSILANQIAVFESECAEKDDLSEILNDPSGIANAIYTNTLGSDVYQNILNILLDLYQFSKKALEGNFSEK